MTRMKRLLVVSGIAVGLVIVVGSGYYLLRPKPLISPNLSSQLTITVFTPQSKLITLERSSVKYDSNNKVLSFVTKYKGQSITLSEQSAPEVFTDVPQYYISWLSSLGETASFGSPIGMVYLAQSNKLGSQPVAVTDAKGTLLFAKPTGQISQDDWQRYFLTMQVYN